MRIAGMDRRVQVLRAAQVDDGLQKTQVFAAHGTRIWASRTDVSDGERAVAGWVEATVVSRFVVWSSAFTRDLTPKDRLVCDGLSFDILGIKGIGWKDRLEITGRARIDVE